MVHGGKANSDAGPRRSRLRKSRAERPICQHVRHTDISTDCARAPTWVRLPSPTEDREDLDPVAELHGRMQRGGNFYDQGGFLRCAARLGNRPYMIDDYFGFRVVRTVR